MLQRDLLFCGDVLEALDDGRMVAAAVCQCGAAAELNIAMGTLVHGGVVRGVGDIHHQGGLRIE